MTFMASWPGGESAHESEQAAQAVVEAMVRSGKHHGVVWEIDDVSADGAQACDVAATAHARGEVDPNYTEGIRGRQSGAERERP